MQLNDLTYKIRGAAFKVHQTLGPGLLEKVYQQALSYQLAKEGLLVQREVAVPILYDGLKLETDLKLDILVDNQVIVELKSVDKLLEVHKKQLQTYLKLSGRQVGLLVNFNCASLDKDSIVRCVNNFTEL